MYKIWYESEVPDVDWPEIPITGWVYNFPDGYEDYCENLEGGEFLTIYENVAIFYMNKLENEHDRVKYEIKRI